MRVSEYMYSIVLVRSDQIEGVNRHPSRNSRSSFLAVEEQVEKAEDKEVGRQKAECIPFKLMATPQ